MDIIGVRLENFLSYESEYVEFAPGTHLVIGYNRDSDIASSNGSGKSGLFDAIPWAFFGSSSRSNISRDGLGDTMVEVSLLPDNMDSLVKVRRFHNHKSGKNRIELLIDDEDVSKHTMKETQIDVNSYVGMSYDHFVSSVIIEQGMSTKLTTLTPTKRKKYFSEVIEFDWKVVENVVKSRLYEADKNINIYNNDKLFISNIISELNGKLKILESMQTISLSKIDDEIKSLTNSININSNDMKITNKNVEVCGDLLIDLNNLYTRDSYIISNEIDKYEKLSSGKCPLCERDYNVNNLKEIKEKLSGLLSEKEKLSLITDKIDEVRSRIRLDKNKVDSVKRNIQMLEIKLSSLMRDKSDYENASRKIDSIKIEMDDNSDKLDEINKNLTVYNKVKDRMNLIKNLTQPSGEVRSFVSMWYLTIYNEILKSLGSYIYPESEIYFDIGESLNDMDLVGVDYYNLSGGEKRRVDILVQIAFSEFISRVSNSSINLLALDEIFVHMDISSINNILPFLQSYFGDSKNIYIISHDEEIKDLFNSYLVVEKKGGISNLLN